MDITYLLAGLFFVIIIVGIYQFTSKETKDVDEIAQGPDELENTKKEIELPVFAISEKEPDVPIKEEILTEQEKVSLEIEQLRKELNLNEETGFGTASTDDDNLNKLIAEAQTLSNEVNSILNDTPIEELEGFEEKLTEIDQLIEEKAFKSALSICEELCNFGEHAEVYWRMYKAQNELHLHTQAFTSISIAFELIDVKDERYILFLLKKLSHAYRCGFFETVIKTYKLFTQYEVSEHYDSAKRAADSIYMEAVDACEVLDKINSDFKQGTLNFEQTIETLVQMGAAELGLALVDENKALSELEQLEYALKFAASNEDHLAYSFALSLYQSEYYSPVVFDCMYNYSLMTEDTLLTATIVKEYEKLFSHTERFKVFKTLIEQSEYSVS